MLRTLLAAGKDIRRKANMRVVQHPNPADIGKPHALWVAARREVLVGNEDLPKSATAPPVKLGAVDRLDE